MNCKSGCAGVIVALLPTLCMAQNEESGADVSEALDTEISFWSGWERQFNVGLGGSTGNNEQFDARLDLRAERKTDRMSTTASAVYQFGTSDGSEDTNEFTAQALHDWLPPEGSKTGYFARGKFDYDEFQDWDYRVGGFGGLNYTFMDTEKNFLIGRLGVGGTFFGGGENEEFRPEGLLGFDWTHTWSETTTFKLGSAAIPSFDDLNVWRAESYARLDVLLDDDGNLVLSAGVDWDYDVDPGGDADRSDLDYFMSLGYKF